MDELAAKFAVSREWLLGSVDYSSNCACRWYKSPSNAIYRLIKMVVDNRKPKIYFVKSKQVNDEQMIIEDNTQHYIAVVAEVGYETPSGQPFKCYERWESLPLDYEKSRIDLLTLVMFCVRFSGWDDDNLSGDAKKVEKRIPRGFYWAGIAVDHAVFTKYQIKKTLLPCDLVSRRGCSTWDIGKYVRFSALSGPVMPAEYNYVKERYEQVLNGFAGWPEFEKLIANAQSRGW